MNIVAVFNLGTDEEALARKLAGALGKTAYEARSRLRVPRGGPSIVAVLAEPEQAESCAAHLGVAGFETVILRQEQIETDSARFLARRVVFDEQALHAESRQGRQITEPYRNIRLLLAGTGITTQVDTETVKGRAFSMGKAIMTGGLLMTKATKREVRTEEQSRERFLYLYARQQPTLVLRENALQYDSLGTSLQASRAANFSHITAEMRQRCPGAVYDDRLLNRSSQVQMLGPQLTPEEHLDIATSLLAQVLLPDQ